MSRKLKVLRLHNLPAIWSHFPADDRRIGRNVEQFQPGDEVFGTNDFSGGGFAEYVCAGQNKLVAKPADISFEDAAALPVAALTALQGLRDKGQIQSTHKVLVDGASGGELPAI